MLIALLAILLTALSIFFGTAVASVRGASRTKLSDVMDCAESDKIIDRFFRLRRQYTRSVLILQQAVHVAFAILLVNSTSDINPPAARWVMVAVSGAAWILCFGVGVPVGWAHYTGDRFLCAVIRPLDFLRRFMRPILSMVNVVDEIIRRLSGAPKDAVDRNQQIELEIMDAVTQGEVSGMMNPAEKEIIKSALSLDEKSVGEVMTPRTDIVGVDVSAGFAEVREKLLSEGHSRIPVYEESLDHVIGMLYAKDMLQITDSLAFEIRRTMRTVMFVPETKDLSSLLREFQINRVHIAIVLDEYGGTAGLVTLEDIMEELIGDIADEHEEPPSPPISRIDERTVDVEARVRVEDLNESLEIELPVDDSYDTIAGYIFSKLGRIPAIGDVADEGDVRIEVLAACDRSIEKVRVHLPEPSAVGE
ncbi:MAG: HlyC/CorC family transporter [Phycisphaerae bacterium]|nr:HlyC/CorC family transporter [Phycisphaerae bacterium]